MDEVGVAISSLFKSHCSVSESSVHLPILQQCFCYKLGIFQLRELNNMICIGNKQLSRNTSRNVAT